MVSTWYTTGSILPPTLEDIEVKHKDDVGRCLQECLTLWLNKADKVKESGGPKLNSLVNALEMIDENFAAEKIKTFSKKFLY